jgi:hypothetical protein
MTPTDVERARQERPRAPLSIGERGDDLRPGKAASPNHPRYAHGGQRCQSARITDQLTANQALR